MFGYDVALAEKIDAEFGSLLATDDEVVCHGDFWPGNVLVGDDGKLTVVDWEMVRRGNGATDVGQFAAEAFLLDRFRGARGLLPAFLNAYAEARGKEFEKEFVKRVVVHWAVHVTFWPTSVEWANEKETGKLVAIGVEALRAVEDGNWDVLWKSPLFDRAEAWRIS